MLESNKLTLIRRYKNYAENDSCKHQIFVPVEGLGPFSMKVFLPKHLNSLNSISEHSPFRYIYHSSFKFKHISQNNNITTLKKALNHITFTKRELI